jgi:hypothetical protein
LTNYYYLEAQSGSSSHSIFNYSLFFVYVELGLLRLTTCATHMVIVANVAGRPTPMPTPRAILSVWDKPGESLFTAVPVAGSAADVPASVGTDWVDFTDDAAEKTKGIS